MALRQSLLTKGLARKADGSNELTSPIERSDAKTNMLKAMRPLPTQHYWNVYFDRPLPPKPSDFLTSKADNYQSNLESIPPQIESIQDFWRMANNTPLDLLKMRESIYLFKAGFKPIWEDRRNVDGGAWTFRVPKEKGADFWIRVQLMAIGEKLQGCLEDGDQLCGVGMSVRFNAHVITVWHRDGSNKKNIDALLKTVLEELPEELQPKEGSYFYKKHSDHEGFKAPPANGSAPSKSD